MRASQMGAREISSRPAPHLITQTCKISTHPSIHPSINQNEFAMPWVCIRQLNTHARRQSTRPMIYFILHHLSWASDGSTISRQPRTTSFIRPIGPSSALRLSREIFKKNSRALSGECPQASAAATNDPGESQAKTGRQAGKQALLHHQQNNDGSTRRNEKANIPHSPPTRGRPRKLFKRHALLMQCSCSADVIHSPPATSREEDLQSSRLSPGSFANPLARLPTHAVPSVDSAF